MSLFRSLPAAAALAAVALLAAGCTATTSGANAPTSSSVPSDASTPPFADAVNEVEVAWLDGGRAFAVLTWGSSSCAPVLGDVAASGQGIRATLAASAEKACTDDLAPQALMVPVPQGVDVTSEVEVEVVHGERTGSARLDALAEPPRGQTEYAPSAGRFDRDGIVLLTWGSSSCPPIVNDVQSTAAGATVGFEEVDGVCTMDLAPRLTPILLPESGEAGAFELTLTGGGLDGKVRVDG
ncbi:hypothetical protein AB0N64_05835 [Microbacterium sp. NPDC089318]